MSTKRLNPALSAALAAVPATFRLRLIKAYVDLKQNTLEGRHDPAGLATGKFCEVALRFLQQKVHGASTPFGTRITSFSDECRRLTAAPTTSGNESERVVIPRALDFLYTMRNNEASVTSGATSMPTALTSQPWQGLRIGSCANSSG